jgi:hypothetical protein
MCTARFPRAPYEVVRRVQRQCKNHDSLRKQNLRRDTVMLMEVLSLYADPIRPALACGDFAPAQGCRVFMHPAMLLGYYTHCVSWDYRNCQVANSERCLT